MGVANLFGHFIAGDAGLVGYQIKYEVPSGLKIQPVIGINANCFARQPLTYPPKTTAQGDWPKLLYKIHRQFV